ncbi:MAG: hypothetical protein Q8N47_14900 [Bryobacterales bacterium]|nr:hypothetical protein [Bryobacterales bacterium]
MSGFNQTSGSIGGGGSQSFNKTSGSTGLAQAAGIGPQYPGQSLDEVFAKLRKKASQLSNGESYSKATGTLDPVQDLVKKAAQKHKDLCKDIVDKAWKAAGQVHNIIEEGFDKTVENAAKNIENAAKNWDKGLV